MGGAFSGEAAGPYPTTGRAITVRVQCSHNGQCVCLSEHRGHCVTSDWTAAHLHGAVEVLTGVHRQCQRLMFAGRPMDDDSTIRSIVGCIEEALPERLKLFLLVDRDKFPQKLGPFSPVAVPLQAEAFELPALTEEFRRCGFYWDMRRSVLEANGLSTRTPRITGQVSPAHPVTMEAAQRAGCGVPKEARDFVWSYPVAEWGDVESDAYSLEKWEEGFQGGAALKSFLSVGGFLYFDAAGRIAGATTFGRPQEGMAGGLHFAEPRRWLPEWTAAMVEQGRFQKVTMLALREVGAKTYMWLRPHEVIEACDGNPLPTQPDVPHGGFVYLFHEDPMAADESELALDRYFAAVPGLLAGAPAMGLFRPFTLVDGDAFPGGRSGAPGACQGAEDEGDEEADDFQMSTPGSTPAHTRNWLSPLRLRNGASP